MLRKLLPFIALVALAGAAVTPVGNWLTRPEYQTYSALTLHVEPDGGSDSNPCTAPGTAACRTLNGAQLKVPKLVRHDVTINLANGTYTEVGTRISGFTIVGSPDGGTPAFIVQGPSTFLAVTPTTGSATGAQTAYAAASGTTLAVLTDSSATWTTNDHKGAFVSMTSGARAGQRRIIISNTATALTLATGFTASPTNGDTFRIEKPGAVFTSPLVIDGIRGVGGGTAAGGNNLQGFALRQVRITATTGRPLTVTNSDSMSLLADMIADGSAGSQLGIRLQGIVGPTLGLHLSNVISFGGSSGLQLINYSGNTVNSTTPPAGTSALGIYLRGTTGALALLDATFTGGAALETTTGTTNAASLSRAARWDIQPAPQITRIICGGTTTSAITATAGAEGGRYVNIISNAALNISGCTNGFNASAPDTLFSHLGASPILFDTVTTAIAVSRGAKVRIGGAAFTFTSVTNEVTYDGTNTTVAAVDALSPKRVCATDNTCVSRE